MDLEDLSRLAIGTRQDAPADGAANSSAAGANAGAGPNDDQFKDLPKVEPRRQPGAAGRSTFGKARFTAGPCSYYITREWATVRFTQEPPWLRNTPRVCAWALYTHAAAAARACSLRTSSLSRTTTSSTTGPAARLGTSNGGLPNPAAGLADRNFRPSCTSERRTSALAEHDVSEKQKDNALQSSRRTAGRTAW